MSLVKTHGYELPSIITVTTTKSRRGGAGIKGVGKETWLVTAGDNRRHVLFLPLGFELCF